MFDGEGEVTAVASQIEIGVTPGMELGRAAERLPGADAAGAFLSVVHDQHRNRMTALQFAQIGEQWGNFATGILIDAMQADEGIEYEQAWLEAGHCLVEFAANGLEIKPHCRFGDDLDIEIGELEASGVADPLKTSPDDVSGSSAA